MTSKIWTIHDDLYAFVITMFLYKLNVLNKFKTLLSQYEFEEVTTDGKVPQNYPEKQASKHLMRHRRPSGRSTVSLYTRQ